MTGHTSLVSITSANSVQVLAHELTDFPLTQEACACSTHTLAQAQFFLPHGLE